MTTDIDEALEQMKLSLLANFCTDEFASFWRKRSTDSRYCVELLRRATVEQVDEAWLLMQSLFSETIRLWVHQHPNRALVLLYDSAENYTAQTFSRFWLAVRKQRLEFSTLSAALSYLHVTLKSVLIDTIRSHMRATHVSLHDTDVSELLSPALEELSQAEGTWAILQSALTNERERRVMYLLYYCGLKPREIATRFPQTFNDVKEIYHLNRVIIERLRRNRDRLGWLLGGKE
jgi:DNA-directed RNA polymerase specialized sigma24 family protein